MSRCLEARQLGLAADSIDIGGGSACAYFTEREWAGSARTTATTGFTRIDNSATSTPTTTSYQMDKNETEFYQLHLNARVVLTYQSGRFRWRLDDARWAHRIGGARS